MSTLFELTRMRMILLVRQPEIVFWAFVFPVMLSMILGLAFRARTLEASPVGLLEGEGAAVLATRLEETGTLAVQRVRERDELDRLLRTGAVDVAIEMPGPGDRPVVRHDNARAEAELAFLRVERALDGPSASLERAPEGGTSSRFVDWFVPGLLALSIMSTSVWAVGFAFVEARQKRLLKRFLVTPMKPAAYLLSVVAARLALLVFEVALLIGFAWLVLDVPVRGSIPALVFVAFLGALAFAGIGILLGSRSRTPEAAAGLINLTMMPMGIAGGVFFSYERFADGLQTVVKLLPLTAFVDTMRGIQLEGRALSEFGSELVILLVWGALAFALGLMVFRWK